MNQDSQKSSFDMYGSKQSNQAPLMSSSQIQKLVESISPNERLDPQVEQLLLEVADNFVDNVASFSWYGLSSHSAWPVRSVCAHDTRALLSPLENCRVARSSYLHQPSMLAKHRGSNTLEVKDVQLHLGISLAMLLCRRSKRTDTQLL